MKAIYLLILFFISLQTFGQTTSDNDLPILLMQLPSVDSTVIIQKAKFLTLGTYGTEEIDSITKEVLSQRHIFHRGKYDTSQAIIAILHNQRFYTKTSDGAIMIPCDQNGRCWYIVLYSYATGKYYRLAGFDALDILACNMDRWNLGLSLPLLLYETEGIVGFPKIKFQLDNNGFIELNDNKQCNECKQAIIR